MERQIRFKVGTVFVTLTSIKQKEKYTSIIINKK